MILKEIVKEKTNKGLTIFFLINAGIFSILLIFGTEIMLALHISGIPTNIIQINYILKVYNERKSN